MPKAELMFKAGFLKMIGDADFNDYEIKLRMDNTADELAALELKLKRARTKLQRCADAYMAGIDSLEEYGTNKANCLKEEYETVIRINELNENVIADEKITLLKERIVSLIPYFFSGEAATEQKSLALKSMVKKIVINRKTNEYKVFYFA